MIFLNLLIVAVREFGDVPYTIIKQILVGCTAQQLKRLEKYNPSIVKEDNSIWKSICMREYPSRVAIEEEMKSKKVSWRKVYYDEVKKYEDKIALTRSKLKKSYDSASQEKSARKAVVLASDSREVQKLGKVKLPKKEHSAIFKKTAAAVMRDYARRPIVKRSQSVQPPVTKAVESPPPVKKAVSPILEKASKRPAPSQSEAEKYPRNIPKTEAPAPKFSEIFAQAAQDKLFNKKRKAN